MVGQNIAIESRWAEGRFERLPDLAAELVRLKVDVIVASVTQASLAAKRATAAIPIVMVGVGDPLGSGLVDNLARPGGNVTGPSSMLAEASGKQLALLKETVPNASPVAVLWNPANPVWQAAALKQTEVAARALGLRLQFLEARGPDELEGAFAAMTRSALGALFVPADIIFVRHAQRLADLAAKHRLPAMYGFREHVEAGGLMSYAASFAVIFRRAATFVDKILKGAKAGDLPVEQPTKFELVINLKTAKTLGITIPQSVLVRADEVIQYEPRRPPVPGSKRSALRRRVFPWGGGLPRFSPLDSFHGAPWPRHGGNALKMAAQGPHSPARGGHSERAESNNHSPSRKDSPRELDGGGNRVCRVGPGGLDMQSHISPVFISQHPFAELDRLGDEIAELSAHLDAATARLLGIDPGVRRTGRWNTASALRRVASLAGGARSGRCP